MWHNSLRIFVRNPISREWTESRVWEAVGVTPKVRNRGSFILHDKWYNITARKQELCTQTVKVRCYQDTHMIAAFR